MPTASSSQKKQVAYITRIESFSAAHRLNANLLSKEDNLAIFGKCNHENFHGHNYKVEVTIKGEIDSTTGMVVNLTDLKLWMQKAIIDVLDHKNIDMDVPHFRDRPSTAENIAVFIWQSLEGILTVGQLHKVKLFETEKNVVTYRGE
ncbi:hypothetical protein SmJEL517_g03310 [Synchytrium microbalum]|uniref:6-pyruvoyl tetrahydrobiopterin synthase n=1 Tax=Synchytrium microbalum TaxID=1806994 RepID=A0A507C363_9FUNG|nr:uncharacterized protein SmJEL517_g03310 [Synchytrium microbalum]TPX33891.1 hypothetical protein SmJEL517_g03310 [Synchytrium microbalum]